MVVRNKSKWKIYPWTIMLYHFVVLLPYSHIVLTSSARWERQTMDDRVQFWGVFWNPDAKRERQPMLHETMVSKTHGFGFRLVSAKLPKQNKNKIGPKRSQRNETEKNFDGNETNETKLKKSSDKDIFLESYWFLLTFEPNQNQRNETGKKLN